MKYTLAFLIVAATAISVTSMDPLDPQANIQAFNAAFSERFKLVTELNTIITKLNANEVQRAAGNCPQLDPFAVHCYESQRNLLHDEMARNERQRDEMARSRMGGKQIHNQDEYEAFIPQLVRNACDRTMLEKIATEHFGTQSPAALSAECDLFELFFVLERNAAQRRTILASWEFTRLQKENLALYTTPRDPKAIISPEERNALMKALRIFISLQRNVFKEILINTYVCKEGDLDYVMAEKIWDASHDQLSKALTEASSRGIGISH